MYGLMFEIKVFKVNYKDCINNNENNLWLPSESLN